MIITAAQLRQIGPSMPPQLAASWAVAFNEVLPKYGMDNPDIFHEFIANVMEESGELQKMSESLNYSVQGLLDTFGLHRITKEQAAMYGRIDGKQKANQQAIANIVYGGTFGRVQLGNDQYGDGWAFRGGGPIQITGRKNYTLLTLHINKITGKPLTIGSVADLIRTDPFYGAHSACWLFAIAKNLIQVAISDDLKKTCKRINGGLTGYPKRIQYYERAKVAIPE